MAGQGGALAAVGSFSSGVSVQPGDQVRCTDHGAVSPCRQVAFRVAPGKAGKSAKLSRARLPILSPTIAHDDPVPGENADETPTPAGLVRGRDRRRRPERPERLPDAAARDADDAALAGLPQALPAVHPADAAVPAAPGTGAPGAGGRRPAGRLTALHPAAAGRSVAAL